MTIEVIETAESRRRNGLLSSFAKDQSGATAVEYALIAAIVFLGIVASVSSIKQPINEILESVTEHFESILAE